MARLIDATRIEQYILNNCSDNEEINAIYAEIVNAPTVDAEPVKQERCEFCKDGKTFLGAVLVLGNDGNWHSIRYCPNCGAKMDENEEHNPCAEEDDYVDPDMYPCRVCDDYDRKRGCLSHGGCGERGEDAD